MFVTHGPVPPGSRLFVGRAAELKRMESWLADVNCVGAVLGARQTGKTSLLFKLRNALRDKYAFAFVDLQVIEGADTDQCFNYIAEQMVEQLAEAIDDEALSLPNDQKTFPAFLREFSRKARAVRIIIILDELGALPAETAIKLASTIRAVFTDRFLKPELARYMFLLAGATDMLELTTGRNSPLGNVTDKIYLGDLSLVETEQLLTEVSGRAGMLPFAEINGYLHTWTSGHPYWTQLMAAALETHIEAPTEKLVGDVAEQLLRTEDRNLPHVIRLLRADHALWNLVESLLNGVPVSFSRADASVARLELIGILKDNEGRCAIRNRIYQEAMHRHQIKPVRLFATNLRILSQQILAGSGLESLLREVARVVQQVLQSRTVVIFTKGPNDRSFRASAAVGVPDRMLLHLEFADESRLLAMLETTFEPLKKDLLGTEQAQLGKLDCVLLVPIRLKSDLMGFLTVGGKLSGEEYDTADREFLATVAEQTAAGIERMSLSEWRQDAERARDIQQELLPKEIPQFAGFQISGTWQPARLVSGDYYDVLKFGVHKFALCIGDVVGKGMSAALLMSNLQAAVKALASESVTPKELCDQVNRLISKNIARGKFITFFYALVDVEARRLIYSNAGHNPPIVLRRDGALLRLDKGGALLGVFPEWSYQEAEVKLTSGDQVVLFTDGVSEAQDSKGEEFGEERLIELLRDARGLAATELLREVIETVARFCSGNFHDDATLIAMMVQ